MTYKVPERSGEVLITPPLDRIPALLAAARERSWGPAHILGTPLEEVRRRIRQRALAQAGPQPPGASPEPRAPLVLMGHQPLFFHPGVWIKFFLLTRLHRALGVTGLHLNVDSDAAGPISCPIPMRTDQVTRRTETLVDLPEDLPLESAAPPARDTWEAFCTRVRGHLATLGSAELPARFDAFVQGAAQSLGRARTLGGFLAGARRSYEARSTPPGYLELPVSALSDTPEFRAFALHLIQDPAGFRGRYNASLEEYRSTHRVRSAANPFPNLGEGEGFCETPLWVVRAGRRAPLLAARSGDRLRLRSGAEPPMDLPAGPGGIEALAASGLRIRPKAITLTMFARLCLGDLFVHGVGGGRYDRVTDALIAEVFGLTPPPYVVATATLCLPLLGTGDGADDGRALERRLMDLQHNPERYLEAPSPPQRGLIDEKWDLIRTVEGMRPGLERRAATHRIREVNRLLAQGLADEIDRTRARLAALDRSSESQAAASFREYPFFLFDPDQVGALVAPP